MRTFIKFMCGMAVAISFAAVQSYGQISLTGGTFSYSENFDGMGPSEGASPPAGWFVGSTKRAGNQDATNGTLIAVALLDADAGGSSTGTNYNYGTSGDGDRALGSLASANAAGSNRVTEVRFTNNTGATITNLTLQYDGEEWRDGGNTAANQLTMHFSLDGSSFSAMGAAFTFTAPVNSSAAQKNGNLAANRVANIGGNFTTSIADGATFYLRWVDIDDASADDGLAIDNFSLSYAVVAVPEPSTILLVCAGLLGAFAIRRRL
jgi:hypothetical protein